MEKLLTTLKQGDYLFIQFGHNDQKPESSSYVKPFIGYKDYLKLFLKTARERGATPVLITPMKRRKFDAQGNLVNTHGDYPAAMRQVAEEENVALIDLNEMSKLLIEALGVEDSKKAFVHYPANRFPNQDKALEDDTHFNNYGAYQLAKCIVEGIKANKLPIRTYLIDDLRHYDPAHPDPLDTWNLPVSSFLITAPVDPE